MNYKSEYNSPLGTITLMADDQHLIGLWLDSQVKYNSDEIKQAQLNDGLNVFNDTKAWLDQYFNNENPPLEKLNIKTSGTPFQEDVWEILKQIPSGETMSYGEIAKRIADKYHIQSMSAQAVGGAVGKNPISIIIPCHRVMGKSGQLTGYAGGIDKKIALLKHEGLQF